MNAKLFVFEARKKHPLGKVRARTTRGDRGFRTRPRLPGKGETPDSICIFIGGGGGGGASRFGGSWRRFTRFRRFVRVATANATWWPSFPGPSASERPVPVPRLPITAFPGDFHGRVAPLFQKDHVENEIIVWRGRKGPFFRGGGVGMKNRAAPTWFICRRAPGDSSVEIGGWEWFWCVFGGENVVSRGRGLEVVW